MIRQFFVLMAVLACCSGCSTISAVRKANKDLHSDFSVVAAVKNDVAESIHRNSFETEWVDRRWWKPFDKWQKLPTVAKWTEDVQEGHQYGISESTSEVSAERVRVYCLLKNEGRVDRHQQVHVTKGGKTLALENVFSWDLKLHLSENGRYLAMTADYSRTRAVVIDLETDEIHFCGQYSRTFGVTNDGKLLYRDRERFMFLRSWNQEGAEDTAISGQFGEDFNCRWAGISTDGETVLVAGNAGKYTDPDNCLKKDYNDLILIRDGKKTVVARDVFLKFNNPSLSRNGEWLTYCSWKWSHEENPQIETQISLIDLTSEIPDPRMISVGEKPSVNNKGVVVYVKEDKWHHNSNKVWVYVNGYGHKKLGKGNHPTITPYKVYWWGIEVSYSDHQKVLHEVALDVDNG